jgi:hypothetical protein
LWTTSVTPAKWRFAPDGTLYVNTWSGIYYYNNDTPPAGGFLFVSTNSLIIKLSKHERSTFPTLMTLNVCRRT